VWYLPPIKHNERLRKEILGLDEKIAKRTEDRKQLMTSIHVLQSDPKAVDRLARERLGFAKPGETVIRFETPATNSLAR
jgi:cell division protein FtsB